LNWVTDTLGNGLGGGSACDAVACIAIATAASVMIFMVRVDLPLEFRIL